MPLKSFPSSRTVTAQEMKRLDERASTEFLIPSLILMENAGRGIADLIAGTGLRPVPILICSGKGNNGGDGFVAARHLANRGCVVTVLLFAGPGELKGDALTNFEIIRKMQVPVHPIRDSKDWGAASDFFKQAGTIVDALFGIGLNAPLTGLYKEAVEQINQSGKTVVAVDIPSGLDADSGEILGAAVQASATGTFGFMKKGMTLKNGPNLCGKVTVIDISLPRGNP